MSISLGPTPKRASMFFSHASADSAILKWVQAQANAMGIELYLAEHDPQPGRNLGDKVLEGISSCDAMLVLLTHNGYGSVFVHQEVGAARHANKPIFALITQDVLDHDRAMLAGAEVIVLDLDDLASSSATLIAALRTLSAARGMPAPPLELRTRPSLQVELSVQLELTANQVMLGLLLLTACAGVIYLASAEGGGVAPPP